MKSECKKAIAQQRFQEMAKNVVNSRFSFARNTILVENMRLRSSPLLEAAKRCVQAYKKKPLSMKNERIIEVLENLIEARNIIFTQIVNLALSGEMKHIEETFNVGEGYHFKLVHFEGIKDINVEKMVSLCKKIEKTIFTLMNLNGITENDVNL